MTWCIFIDEIQNKSFEIVIDSREIRNKIVAFFVGLYLHSFVLFHASHPSHPLSCYAMLWWHGTFITPPSISHHSFVRPPPPTPQLNPTLPFSTDFWHRILFFLPCFSYPVRDVTCKNAHTNCDVIVRKFGVFSPSYTIEGGIGKKYKNTGIFIYNIITIYLFFTHSFRSGENNEITFCLFVSSSFFFFVLFKGKKTRLFQMGWRTSLLIFMKERQDINFPHVNQSPLTVCIFPQFIMSINIHLSNWWWWWRNMASYFCLHLQPQD